jgi:hypothetical protein
MSQMSDTRPLAGPLSALSGPCEEIDLLARLGS